MVSVNISSLHNDIKAALVAKIPLGESGKLTINDLERLKQKALKANSEGIASSHASMELKEFNASFPEWYRAAAKFYSITGSTVPILQGLTAVPTATKEVYKALRWPCLYLLLVFASALLGLSVFLLGTASAFESFNRDTGQTILPNLLLQGIVIGLSVLLAISVTWIFFGGITKLAMLLGGRRYLANRVSATALDIARQLVQSGETTPGAIELACELTGAKPRIQQELDAIMGSDQHDQTFAKMADYKNLTASRQLARLRYSTPIVLIALLGGTLALIYCLIIFSPVFSLFKNLPELGV